MKFSKVYSILVEGAEAGDRGFFITFKVLARSVDEAIELLRSSDDMRELTDPHIEEVEDKGISIRHLFASRPEILHQTGRAYFNLDQA